MALTLIKAAEVRTKYIVVPIGVIKTVRIDILRIEMVVRGATGESSVHLEAGDPESSHDFAAADKPSKDRQQ